MKTTHGRIGLVRLLGLLALATAACPGAAAAPADAAHASHRIVFELTGGQPEAWTALLNNLENVRRALGPETALEVVAHGPGLEMLQTPNPEQIARMQALADAGVVFAACENTMKRRQVAKSDLLPFATTVDSGVAEIVRKQASGWSYIRSG